MYVHICIIIYKCICVYIYIYVQREREERDIARSIDSVLAARPSFEPYATVP